ncbi:MAG: 6-phosphofructokinase [Candidatus Omnitrophica bacterium]|nr:6-phosphofructokinase [Candidatus Omnitrophota bacterium]
MILTNLPLYRHIKRAVSLLVVVSFVFSNVAFADISKTTSLDAKKPVEITTDPDKIVIPRDYGLIKSKYTARDSKRLVIHIQDAHCNYEAQSNIIKILECLVKNDGLSLVSVEGADGFIDTSWFKAFPDADIRKEVADYFMKKGEITGPEFLSITSDLPIKLFGAETRSYYIDNLNAFTSSYPLKEDTERYFNRIKAVLNKLKITIYSEELKEFDQKTQDYESKKISFTDYIKYLEILAARYKVSLRRYENLFKLVSVLIYEKKIDFNVVDKERAALIDAITKKLDKDQLAELVNKSLEFKVGKISSVEYYNYLRALAAKYGITLSSEYPNLFNYIIYNSVYSRIENEHLFNDIKKFEEALKERMFADDDQRTLDKLSRHINILLGLTNIKLLNGDFDYYKERKEEFSHEVFAGFINRMAAKFGFAYEIDPPSEAVVESMPKLEDFYAIAIKRDKALVDNTMQAMKKENAQISVLVTGGFHSEGITKLLEKQGVSYLVICPNITKDVETPYIKILTNQRTPLEEILSDTGAATADAKNVKGSMLAPYLITAARTAKIEEIADRTREDLELWARMNISPWIPVALSDLVKMGIQPKAAILVVRFNSDVDAALKRYAKENELEGKDLEAFKKSAKEVKKIAKGIIAELMERQSAYTVSGAKKIEWPDPKDVTPDKRIVMLISGGEAPGVNEYFWRDAEMHAELGYSVEVMHFGLKGLLKGKLEVGNNGRTWVNWERARGINGMPGAFAGTSRVKMSKSEIFKMLWDAADYTKTLEFIGGNDHLGEAAKVGEIINQITGADDYADFKGEKEEFVKALKDILNKADISQSEIESVFNELHKKLKDMLVIALPKTIDGDTKVYPMGASTAHDRNEELIRRAAHNPFTKEEIAAGKRACSVVQVMGRDNGYLAVVDGNPTYLLLLPEWSRGVKWDTVREAVKSRLDKYGVCTVVTSEGFGIEYNEKGKVSGWPIIDEILERYHNPVLQAKYDNLGRDDQGNPLVTELAFADFVATALGADKEMGLKKRGHDKNLFLENPAYSFRDTEPNDIDKAVAEFAIPIAIDISTNPALRREWISRGGVCIAADAGAMTMEKIRDTMKARSLTEVTGKISLKDDVIFTEDELNEMNIIGHSDSAVNSLPDIKDIKVKERPAGVSFKTAEWATDSQAESLLDMARPDSRMINICVISRKDESEGNALIGALRDRKPAMFSPAEYVRNRTKSVASYVTSAEDMTLYELAKRIAGSVDKKNMAHLIISDKFKVHKDDALIKRLMKNPICATLLSNAQVTEDGKSYIFGARLADLLDYAFKEALGKKIKKIRSNILGESLNMLPGEEAGPTALGAIRANGGASEQGAITVDGAELTDSQKIEINGKIRSDFESGKARLVETINGVEIYEIPGLEDLTYLVAHPGRGGDACDHKARRIYLSPSKVRVYNSLSPINKEKFLKHEIAHLDNPRLAEDIIEVLAPSHDVRLEILTKDMSGSQKKAIDEVYSDVYKKAVNGGKEYAPENVASEYGISVDIARALLDKIAEESGYNAIKRDMYQSVISNTPAAIKESSLLDVSEKGRMTIEFTRENLEDFDPVKNPKGMNLKSWLKKYKKEASVSTAGIRGLQNILFPNDPRELMGEKAIILANVAKALVARSSYSGEEIHKFASSEVRFNSREYVECIARIQAALGIKTCVPLDGATTPIWMASFLIFKYDLMGGEYVTSSHAISKKIATKDLNSEGSQFTPDESILFVKKIEEIIAQIEDKGVYSVILAAMNDENIDQVFMRKVNNGIEDYVKYLKTGIATRNNIQLIKEGENKIFIDVVGGCMYRTMSKVFNKLGITEKFRWLHIKEDPYFHGIGKSCYRLNTENGKLGFEDLSCDTSIVAINEKEDVERIMGFVEKFKDSISKKAVGTQILIPVPGSNSKIFGQIRASNDPDLRLLKNVVSVDLGEGKLFVCETGIRILPVIKTMGYKQSLKDAPVGTVIELTDPDGDRLITAQIVNIEKREMLEKLGLAYEILDSRRVLVVFMPNQSFLMTIDFRKEMLKRDGEWAKRNWFMIKTTASAAAWDDWAAAQSDKSYKIKYTGTNDWVDAKGVPVINTPVGFKEIASIMKKAEKQMREAPDRDVIIEDVFGNQINLGVQPRLLFAGEESGGEIFGPTELIESVNGRRALAMREKSAGEAMVITSAMAADLEAKGMTLVDYLVNINSENKIVNRFDYREDIIYFNESEPDINVRKAAEAEGLKMKEENDFFFLAIAIALRDGKITFDQASVFLRKLFPAVDFEELKGVYFVGDGVYLKFTDRVVEIRPSGTEAKTKGYAMGASPTMLVNDAKALAGYYSNEMRDRLVDLLGAETHAAYFKESEFMGTKMPAVKVRAMEIYSAYLANGAETKQFVPPTDYKYLNVPIWAKSEKENASFISQKLHTPLVAATPEMAARFMQGGYNQVGYGLPAGAAIDGSFAIGQEGNQGYYVDGGKKIFLDTVQSMKDFFARREARLGKQIKYVIKPGIGGQHTPFQGIADAFQLIDVATGKVVGEYELGKDYEAALSANLKELGSRWDQIAVIPSSKSGSTDETMMIFTEIFYVLLKNVAAEKGVNGELFAQSVLDTMHDVNFANGIERPAKDLFKGFSAALVANKFDGRLGVGGVKQILDIVLGNMFFETTDRPQQSRLSAFIRNSELTKELDKEDIPGFGAMFDNVGGRWTADLHMMTFLAYHKLDAEGYWNTRYEGIKKVREGTHKANELADIISNESITDIALVVPDELFWFGKAMEQNFNESIWQNGFANLVAIKESAWEVQKSHYAGEASRLVINISSLDIPAASFNTAPLGEFKLDGVGKQKLADSLGELFTTFYGMTHNVGNRLIARALAEKGFAPEDVDINDLDNPVTRIFQQNLYVRQPYVELGKGLLEHKLKTLQAKGQHAIDEELNRIKAAARDREIESNTPELNLPGKIADVEQLTAAIIQAAEFAKESGRKFVPFIYLEGEKFLEIRELLISLGVEWVMQGTGDQHISYQQPLAQPQKYLPFIISFVPENTLSGRPAVGFAKGYLNNVSPNMVRDLFAEASYKALTAYRKNEAGEHVKGAAGIFLRLTDSDDDRNMLIESFKAAIKALKPVEDSAEELSPVSSETSSIGDEMVRMIEEREPELAQNPNYQKYVRPYIANFMETLASTGFDNKTKEDVTTVLAHDTAISLEQQEAVQLMHKLLAKYLGKSVITVRGTGAALVGAIDDNIRSLRASGKKFAVIAMTGKDTFDKYGQGADGLLAKINDVNGYMKTTFKEDAEKLPISAVLNVQDRMPLMPLYDVALRLAYNLGSEKILEGLRAVARDENNQPFTKDNLLEFLKRGYICLKPIVPIDFNAAIEASKAESAALRSL